MADQRSYPRFRNMCLSLCAVTLIILCWASILSGQPFGSEGSIWLCMLFSLPVVIQGVGVWHLESKVESNHRFLPAVAQRPTETNSTSPDLNAETENNVEPVNALIAYAKFYWITMAICLISYSSLWVCYANGQQYYDWETVTWAKGLEKMTWFWSQVYFGLSLTALLIIAVLTFLVLCMTRAIIGINQQRKPRFEFLDLYRLRRGAAEAPFLTLIFFITVFLGVSYLFGFAFAFHDKARLFTSGAGDHKEPALVMNTLTVPDALSQSSPLRPPAVVAQLTFDSGTSIPGPESDGQVTKAVNEIENRTNEDHAVRILLIGGADLRQIKSRAYQSNYELAEARANSTKSLLLERLSMSKSANVLRNLEWTCLARPNEGLNQDSNHTRKSAVPDAEGAEDRTVKVVLVDTFEAPPQLAVRNIRANHPRQLRLMDYVYFANYTITTTGYGDIVPNTTYAKFVCSFANICEVLFLVVFFNALLSLGSALTMSSIAEQVSVLFNNWKSRRIK